ncbi:MAG: adenylate/guanylate cyclase domain-containing protein [Pseudomonadota bacterium]
MTGKQEFEAWLHERGVGDAAEPLIEADVDKEILAELEENDLRELGFNLGLRKKLLKVITDLRPQYPGVDMTRRKPERRQITVLFTDLVGSTRLATKFEAEDWATILQEYHGACAQIAEKWGGRMTSQFGDGCMVIFGHPRINEDDAERAVHSALEMIERMQEAGPFDGERLKIRVAISTGRVVIGDLTGRSDPNAIAGDTPNLAARLQDIAKPGCVVISPSTRKLCAHAFEFEELGAYTLKGFADPVEAVRVIGEREAGARFFADDADYAADLVGRDEELALLTKDWAAVRDGACRVALLSGEPGIGKTQLKTAFAHHALAASTNARRVRLFASPFHRNTAFHAFQQHLYWEAGVTREDEPATTRDKLKTYCDDHPALNPDHLALLENGGADETLNAGQRMAMTLALYEALMREKAAAGPLLIEFEDAHWADPSSLELLSRIAGVAPGSTPLAGAMVIATHRPDSGPPWLENDWIRRIALARLGFEESADIIRGVLGPRLPEARLREIVAKAEGVPLHLREMSRAIAEANDEGGLVGGAIKVPETIEDSLMSRLDHAGAAKSIAQVAALLGRVFDAPMLIKVSDEREETVRAALAQLIDAELIRGEPDGDNFVFGHALMQDAAYASMLVRDRRIYHARAVEILSSAPRPPAPEVLARHFAGADQPLAAAAKLIEAGQSSMSRAAQVEANNHFRSVLELLSKTEESAETLTIEATANALLGQSLIATVGFGAEEIASSFDKARALSDRLENMPLLLASIYGSWAVTAARGGSEETRRLADEGLRLFGDSNEPLFALGAHFMDGVTHLYMRNLNEARVALHRAVDNYDPALHPHVIQSFGDDLGTFALTYLQWIASLRGDFAEAMALSERGRELAEQLDDKQVAIRSLGFAMSGAQLVGAVEMTRELGDRLMTLAMESCYPHWIALAQVGRGWATCHETGAPDGVEEIRAALNFYEMIGQKTPLSLVHANMVEAMIQVGDRQGALEMADTAIAACRSSLDSVYLAELMRLRADCLPNRAERLDALKAALRETEVGGMAFFALRIAASLVRETDGDPEAVDNLRRLRSEVTSPVPLPFLASADKLLTAA